MQKIYLYKIFVLSVVAGISNSHLILEKESTFNRGPNILSPQTDQCTPSEIMVDLTNDLSYKILYLHSVLNRNNYAFSPTALMCALIAIYEGSAGRSSLELRNSLQFPHNRDIIRIGYRDIHRRLRTYFFDEENPLIGLSLNQENVTVTSEYETILKFYGFELGMDMISSILLSTPLPEDTTTVTSVVEKTTKVIPTTTDFQTETSSTDESTPEPITDPTHKEVSITPTTSGEESDEALTPNQPETTEETTKRPKPSGKLISRPVQTYLPPKLTSPLDNPLKRNRRHLFDLTHFDKSFFTTFIQPKAQYLQAPPPAISVEIVPPPLPAPEYISHFASTHPFEQPVFFGPPAPTFSLFPLKSPLDQTLVRLPKHGNHNEDIDDIFYVSKQEIIHTMYKIYNSVMYYKYFDQLKLSVLELELDSTDYNLMIFLPDFDVDFTTAVSTLRAAPTLRNLRKQLTPQWIQASIPDFKLHGVIFLTNDLQHMGICDIFEPNRADFRPMTNEGNVYVKHIEQAIRVNIRTRPINHLKRSHAPHTQPIQVSVNHPFLFFIIDRDLDVATMTGRVMNPLNVRIH